jgi:hypothetical protein
VLSGPPPDEDAGLVQLAADLDAVEHEATHTASRGEGAE